MQYAVDYGFFYLSIYFLEWRDVFGFVWCGGFLRVFCWCGFLVFFFSLCDFYNLNSTLHFKNKPSLRWTFNDNLITQIISVRNMRDVFVAETVNAVSFLHNGNNHWRSGTIFAEQLVQLPTIGFSRGWECVLCGSGHSAIPFQCLAQFGHCWGSW